MDLDMIRVSVVKASSTASFAETQKKDYHSNLPLGKKSHTTPEDI